MYLYYLLIVLGSVAATFLDKAAPPRNGGYKIVGGNDVHKGFGTYMVSLQTTELNICGGSILNKRWILSAATCYSSTQVRVGSGFHNTGGQLYDIDKKVVHEKKAVVNGEYIHNIALFRVSKDIQFNEDVKPVQLPSEDIEAGLDVVVMGWGKTENGYPAYLQIVNMTTLSLFECRILMSNMKFPFLSDNQLCALARNKGVCTGDWGGPLMAENVQVGIVSYLYTDNTACPCAQGYPDIYTKVYSYLDWIKKHIDGH